MDFEKFQRDFAKLDRFKQEHQRDAKLLEQAEKTVLSGVIDLSKKNSKAPGSEAALSTKANSKDSKQGGKLRFQLQGKQGMAFK